MIDFLKPFFDGKTLTFEELQEALGGSDVKPVNLASGDYVSRAKYETEIHAKDKDIETLKQTMEKNKTDLSDLKSLIEKAGTDEDGLKKTLGKISELEQQAKNDKADFDKRLEHTKKEAAVKVFASGIEFSSKTAKNGFISAYLAADPELNESGEVVNGNEFLQQFEKDDPGAVKKKEEDDKPHIIDRTKPNPPAPSFNLTELMKN